MRREIVRLRKRCTAGGLLLMYHRVSPSGVDPWRLNVTPGHFAQHLDVLRRCAHPITLGQLVQACRAGRLIDRSVVVTFDDGYANNLHTAKPILERFDIPATVFVTTGYTGRDGEFWWDELDQLLLHAAPLPPELHLTLRGTTRHWALGPAAWEGQDLTQTASKAIPGTRLGFFHDVWKALRAVPEEVRRDALDQIGSWSGRTPVTRPTHRPLTCDESVQLADGGLVEVGAHTVTHPLLTDLLPIEQKREIHKSKTDLEAVIGHAVTSFSYPFGQCGPDSVALVRESGFAGACTGKEETCWRHSDPYQLPRFGVKDWDGEEFERRLAQWFQQYLAPS